MASDNTSRKASFATTIEPTEDTPLLERKASRVSILWKQSAVYRVLLTGFLVSLSFGVTQVPLIYVFGVMTCEEYYRTHPEPPPGIERCRIHAIEASTSRQIALLGASTTLFGVVNLFFAGWTIKAFGLKKALLMTVTFPALRLVIQNVGVEMGAGIGMIVVQASQVVTVVGGPVGYLLALNSYATEVVEPSARTATLGRLTGCCMVGTSLGFLIGGLLGDAFSIIMPFRVTVVLFVLSTVYIWTCLPAIAGSQVPAQANKSLSAFLDPIKMFAPSKWQRPDGTVRTEYGVLFLGIGTFLGVLATSYIPTMLQMYATDVFDFGTAENGWLISLNLLVRGLFLTLCFPQIIAYGRKWMEKRTHARKQAAKQDEIAASAEDETPGIPTDADELAATADPIEGEREPIEPTPQQPEEDMHFDLHFTKYSLIADGLLTGLATFTKQGWQLYVIAVVLPLASGTGSAAKGTILQMCPASQRQDALSAISLVELLARMSGISVFGLVFSGFADIGMPSLTFACNAATAVVGFAVLLFSRFPAEGSVRYRKGGGEEEILDGEE